MTPEKVTKDALREAMRQTLNEHPIGISVNQALVMAYADLTGDALDPFALDDAAVILRAERLVQDGVAAREALQTAREELPTWAGITTEEQ